MGSAFLRQSDEHFYPCSIGAVLRADSCCNWTSICINLWSWLVLSVFYFLTLHIFIYAFLDFYFYISAILIQKPVVRDLTESAEKTFKLFQSQERELVNKYNHVVGLWRRVSEIFYFTSIRFAIWSITLLKYFNLFCWNCCILWFGKCDIGFRFQLLPENCIMWMPWDCYIP